MPFRTEDAVRERRKSTVFQRRVYGLFAVGFLSAVIFIVSIAVPITVHQGRDHCRREERRCIETKETELWVSKLRNDVIEAIAAVHVLGGVVYADMTLTPPFNGSQSERVNGQQFSRFDDLALQLQSRMGTFAVYMLAPGAVVTQTVPPKKEAYMYDFLRHDSALGKPTVLESIDSAEVAALGPLYRGIPVLNMSWQLIVRYPLYNVTNMTGASRKNFWGFVLVVLDVDSLIDEHLSVKEMPKRQVEYLIYTMCSTKGDIVPIRFSMGGKPTRQEMMAFISGGTDQPVLHRRMTWRVCTRVVDHEPRLTKAAIIFIVFMALVFALLFFLVGATVVLLRFRHYNDRSNAPKTPPFALAIIGLCNGEQLWEQAPAYMMQAFDRLVALQRREIVRHRACEGTQIHPYTTTIITRNADAAVNLCFAVLEGMRTQPIDGSLREVLGEEGRLFVACAVHWCLDATVRLESVGGEIRYEGPDVVYGGRMWMFAAPNKVSISSAARQVLKEMPGVESQLLGSVFLRGVEGQQDIFVISEVGGRRHKKPSALCKTCTIYRIVSGLPFVKKNRVQSVLSFGTSSPAPNGDHPLGNAEMNGRPHHETSVAPVGCNSNGTAVGSDGGRAYNNNKNGAGEQGPADTTHGAKNPSQSSALDTLFELVRTDSMVISELAHEECLRTPHRSLQSSTTMKFSTSENHAPVSSDALKRSSTYYEGWMSRNNSNLGRNWNTVGNRNARTRGDNDTWARSRYRGAPCDKCSDETLPDGDFLAKALLKPKVPRSLDTHLRTVFERQSLIYDISYDSVRTIVYYFYSAFKLLLKPLAAPERSNIFHRFVTAFGVPQQHTLEHLAARCALRYVQNQETTRSLLRSCGGQTRLKFSAMLRLGNTTQVSTSSVNLRNEESLGNSFARSAGLTEEDKQGSTKKERLEYI